MSAYAEFLASKQVYAAPCGFQIDPATLNPMLKDFQRDVVIWDCRRGKAANFMHTGMGKGPIQLEWGQQVVRHTGGDVLLAAPLAVAEQFMHEAKKFHYRVTLCESREDVRPGINITNYDRIDRFNMTRFHGVALDESSCIKDWTSKTTKGLIETLRNTPYKLCSTATPSPNDHAELGTHAELLDVMTRAQMLAMFFEHDGGETSKWKLKGHGKRPFWKWVASWAVCLKLPSDLGYDDTGYILPPLNIEEHVVKVDMSVATEGMLFRCPDLSATGLHKEMRLTCEARAAKVAELVCENPNVPWLIWCNTNYEADAIKAILSGVVEVRGNTPRDKKKAALISFALGEFPWMLTKPDIAGFGMNYQHCWNMAFCGLSYSWEKLLQAIARCHRYGQTHEVNAHIVISETEGPVLATIRRKEAQDEERRVEMNAAMREEQLAARHKSNKYEHLMEMEVPAWLTN